MQAYARGLSALATIAALTAASAAMADIRIGFTGVLSGPQAALGQDQYDGLMLGIELARPCGVLAMRAMQAGLLINVTRDRVIRMLPPLILNQDEADRIVAILVPLIRDFLAEQS